MQKSILLSLRFYFQLFHTIVYLLQQVHSSSDDFIDLPSIWQLKGNASCPFGSGNLRNKIKIKRIKHANRPVPENFDARQNWPYCESIGRIINQGACGSCWAVSIATMLSDRFCIEHKKSGFQFSIEDVLTCCPESCVPEADRCKGGGNVYYGLVFCSKMGVVSGGDVYSGTGCKPLDPTSVHSGYTLPCQKHCTNLNYRISYKTDKRKCKDMAAMFEPWKIKQLQIEIMINGPILATMFPTEYFLLHYKNGVYMGDNTKVAGGHGLRLIGWGTENGVPYWLVANSWGKEWGMGGFFKILRGSNTSGIEQYAFAAYFHTFSSARSSHTSSSFVFFIMLCSLTVILRVIC